MSIKDIGDGWLRFLMVRFFNKELPEKTKKIVEERFDCYNIKVNPSLNGKAFSSDVAFGTIAANSGRYRDRIN